jgi:hypothetical protein
MCCFVLGLHFTMLFILPTISFRTRSEGWMVQYCLNHSLLRIQLRTKTQRGSFCYICHFLERTSTNKIAGSRRSFIHLFYLDGLMGVGVFLFGTLSRILRRIERELFITTIKPWSLSSCHFSGSGFIMSLGDIFFFSFLILVPGYQRARYTPKRRKSVVSAGHVLIGGFFM